MFKRKMDRKKSKLNNIVVQFNAIINETTVLKENVEIIINQVFSCVDYVKETPDDNVGQTCTDILKYELEVLTKLVDMNSLLEDIWDSNIIDKWNIPRKKYVTENDLENHIIPIDAQYAGFQLPDSQNTETSIEANVEENSVHQNGTYNPMANCSTYVTHQSEIDSIPSAEVMSNYQLLQSHRSRTVDLPQSIPQFSNQIETNVSHLSESHSVPTSEEVIVNSQVPQSSQSESIVNDEDISPSNIQIVRQHLKLWNEKLGFSPITYSDMADHYKKSGGVSLESSVNPSGQQYANSDAQQIPERLERDLSEIVSPSMSNIDIEIANEGNEYVTPDIGTPYSFSDFSGVSSDISNSNGRDKTAAQSHKSNIYHKNSEIINGIEESCTYDITDQKHSSSNSKPIVNDFDSHLEHSDFSELALNYDSADNLGKSEKSTALKKLNNYEIRHKQELKAALVEPPHIPDISLKPTKLENIPEYISEDSDLAKMAPKSKKKRSKHQTIEINYDLRSKKIPTVGDACVFSHIESPSEFYLHIVDKETATIDKLTEKIDANFNGSTSKYRTKQDAYNNIKKYCCAFIKDYNSWYRVSISNWKLNDSEDVVVQLVDFGNSKVTSYRNLRKLTKEMSEMPMFAVRCHLPLMYPPGSTNLNRISMWPLDSTEALYSLSGVLEGSRSIEFELVYVEAEPNSIAVDLHNPNETNNDDTVGQVLLNLGFAVQLVDDIDEDNMELEEFLQDTDTLETADNVNEAVMGYDPQDEVRICRFTKPDGSCFKGKHCKLDHTFLPEDGFTTDTEFVFREAFYPLCLPLPKETVTILITGYIDSCTFYAHVVRNPHRESNYLIEKDLFELEKVMNTEKIIRTYEVFKISPAIGEMVLVKDWTKKWRRAVVRGVEVANNGGPLAAQVFTLDIGETLTVDMIHVRKIKPQFLQLPFQTIQCYISDYKASTKCNQKDAKDFFDRNLYFQNFFAYIMSSFLPLKIIMKSLSGLDIGHILENKNFADKQLCDNNPLEDCSLDFY
ncbi:unnamed protein product [Phaedon cochleariae]|uniref:Uncharacterized protein n=1 Tax=Phaedon cochleariae TaxID=80249 RepID=A0A9P0GWF1_PHACE|nr:unnamed protein product [Phaedon cochleariae]